MMVDREKKFQGVVECWNRFEFLDIKRSNGLEDEEIRLVFLSLK